MGVQGASGPSEANGSADCVAEAGSCRQLAEEV